MGIAVHSDPASSVRSREGKYLTFTLDSQEYGIGVLKIREIIGITEITHVPQMPDYVRGLINLRGKVIPVIDFRIKFGLKAGEQTSQTCIIVMSVETPEGPVLVGGVMDAVSEVLNIKNEEIEDAVSFGSQIDDDFILGIAKVNDGIKILLDIDRILSVSQIHQVMKQD